MPTLPPVTARLNRLGSMPDLGALDHAVDQPVQEPPDDQAQQGEADQRAAACRRASRRRWRAAGRRSRCRPSRRCLRRRHRCRRAKACSPVWRLLQPNPSRPAATARGSVSETTTAAARARRGCGYRVPRDHARASPPLPGSPPAPAFRIVALGLALLAAPAHADVAEGWSNPDDVDALHALLLLGGVPLLLFVLIALAVYIPALVRGEDVSPTGGGAESQWFGGPRQAPRSSRPATPSRARPVELVAAGDLTLARARRARQGHPRRRAVVPLRVLRLHRQRRGRRRGPTPSACTPRWSRRPTACW